MAPEAAEQANADGDGEGASEEQAIENVEATDAEEIRGGLPEDVRDRLTKRAFSPGAIRLLLRDTYYIGPKQIGTGGWIGVYGGGQPGTGLRRPGGAFYGFPRSWRYAALERGLETGIVTHVGGGAFAATERGVALLDVIDRCPDCDVRREPMVRHSHYRGNPMTGAGAIENHRLVTECPECGGTGYDYGSGTVGYEEFERDEEAVEHAEERIADDPAARTYGGSRPIRDEAASEPPEIDGEEIEEVLAEQVEAYTPPDPRELFHGHDQDQFDRPVITLDREGDLYRFAGTDESLLVTRRDEPAEVHVVLDDDGLLRFEMSYETAVRQNAKGNVGGRKEADWTGEHWTLEPKALPAVVGLLTKEGTALHNEDPAFEVTATPEAIEAVTVPMLGINPDGSLID